MIDSSAAMAADGAAGASGEGASSDVRFVTKALTSAQSSAMDGEVAERMASAFEQGLRGPRERLALLSEARSVLRDVPAPLASVVVRRPGADVDELLGDTPEFQRFVDRSRRFLVSELASDLAAGRIRNPAYELELYRAMGFWGGVAKVFQGAGKVVTGGLKVIGGVADLALAGASAGVATVGLAAGCAVFAPATSKVPCVTVGFTTFIYPQFDRERAAAMWQIADGYLEANAGANLVVDGLVEIAEDPDPGNPATEICNAVNQAVGRPPNGCYPRIGQPPLL